MKNTSENKTAGMSKAAFDTALAKLFKSPVWVMLARADKEARENPPIHGRGNWNNPTGHEGVNHQLIRVGQISDKYSKRFMRREMGY